MRRMYRLYTLIPYEKEPETKLESGELVLKKAESKALPEDWPFMEACGKVLENIPETWKPYPSTADGKMAIIDMEYGELKKAKTKEEKMRELEHVASACLYSWRELDAE